MLWWSALNEDQQDDVAHCLGLLVELGPALGFPYSSKVQRLASHGRHIARVAYAERGKTFGLRTLVTHSTLSARQLCSWAETKPAMITLVRKPVPVGGPASRSAPG